MCASRSNCDISRPSSPRAGEVSGRALWVFVVCSATASGFGALVPPLFQRARRYLNGLTHDSIQVLALPLAEPPLLLFGGRDIFVILLLNPGAPIDPVIAQAHFLARELDWLLGCRAIVRMT